MKTKELRNLNKSSLIKKRDELKLLLAGCHKGVKPLFPVTKRKIIKKEIAKINTLLKEMEK